jgi:hypothetical protein
MIDFTYVLLTETTITNNSKNGLYAAIKSKLQDGWRRHGSIFVVHDSNAGSQKYYQFFYKRV